MRLCRNIRNYHQTRHTGPRQIHSRAGCGRYPEVVPAPDRDIRGQAVAGIDTPPLVIPAPDRDIRGQAVAGIDTPPARHSREGGNPVFSCILINFLLFIETVTKCHFEQSEKSMSRLKGGILKISPCGRYDKLNVFKKHSIYLDKIFQRGYYHQPSTVRTHY
jgi:hypothetical protein